MILAYFSEFWATLGYSGQWLWATRLCCHEENSSLDSSGFPSCSMCFQAQLLPSLLHQGQEREQRAGTVLVIERPFQWLLFARSLQYHGSNLLLHIRSGLSVGIGESPHMKRACNVSSFAAAAFGTCTTRWPTAVARSLPTEAKTFSRSNHKDATEDDFWNPRFLGPQDKDARSLCLRGLSGPSRGSPTS